MGDEYVFRRCCEAVGHLKSAIAALQKPTQYKSGLLSRGAEMSSQLLLVNCFYVCFNCFLVSEGSNCKFFHMKTFPEHLCFFQDRVYCVAWAVLELTLETRLGWDTETHQPLLRLKARTTTLQQEKKNLKTQEGLSKFSNFQFQVCQRSFGLGCAAAFWLLESHLPFTGIWFAPALYDLTILPKEDPILLRPIFPVCI